jgi:hypothetical protein
LDESNQVRKSIAEVLFPLSLSTSACQLLKEYKEEALRMGKQETSLKYTVHLLDFKVKKVYKFTYLYYDQLHTQRVYRWFQQIILQNIYQMKNSKVHNIINIGLPYMENSLYGIQPQ